MHGRDLLWESSRGLGNPCRKGFPALLCSRSCGSQWQWRRDELSAGSHESQKQSSSVLVCLWKRWRTGKLLKIPIFFSPNTFPWLYIYIWYLFSREEERAVWEGPLLGEDGFVIQTKTNLNRALREQGNWDSSFLFWPKNRSFLCMPAAAGVQGWLVPAQRSLYLCAHKHSWGHSCWLGEFLYQVLKRSGREGVELANHALSVCTLVEQAVMLPHLGLTCLSPDTAESRLMTWSCCRTHLGKTLWLCLSFQVETGALNWGWAVPVPACRLALLSSHYLAPVLSFP